MAKPTRFMYTSQKSGFRSDTVYENPAYFEKLPRMGFKTFAEVIVEGHHPRIEAALDAAKIEWRRATVGDGPRETTTDAHGHPDGAPVPPHAPMRVGGGSPSDDGTRAPIPEQWQDMKWPEMRALASSFTADTIARKDQAVSVIENEIARRSASTE